MRRSECVMPGRLNVDRSQLGFVTLWDRLRVSWPELMAACLYVAVVGAAILHHEPWADEAQAWLLARDSSLVHLWTKLLGNEGTPGLWHTLLHVLIRLGLPYSALNVVSGVLGFAATILILRYAPMPLPGRILLPFTFFLCYQYAVVGRSYSLVPPLLFGLAAVERWREKRIRLITVLLILIAAVSAQAFILSACVWVVFYSDIARRWATFGADGRKRVLAWGSAYIVAALSVVIAVWPRSDAMFVGTPDLSPSRLWGITRYGFEQAFGSGALAVLVIALSARHLWRGGTLVLFVLSSAALCIFGALVYSNAWHHGFLLLAWLVTTWMAGNRVRLDLAVTSALLIVIAIQCYWTFRSVAYDWTSPYSGSRSAALYLKEHRMFQQKMYGVGFSSAAIQPYFNRNIYANFGRPTDPAFWGWSRANHAKDMTERLGSENVAYVIVGYASDSERQLWTHIVKESGYEFVKRFDGGIFWRTSVLQPEAFELYKRGEHARDFSLESVVNMADERASAQLESGFYELSDHAWRWTARGFSVALQRPRGSENTGARLVLQVFVPETQIQKLGRMKLTVWVAGHRLQPFRLEKGGAYTCVRDVPAADLYAAVVPLAFKLDKAASPSKSDERELGIVVSSIGLFAN